MEQQADISYHSIEDLPIMVFLDILKTGEYTKLGNHEDHAKVWLDIYDDYCTKSGVDNSNLKTTCKVNSLKAKYTFIMACLEKLRYSHYLRSVDGFEENKKLIADELRRKGYLFNASKPFEEEIARLHMQSESLKMKITIEEGKIQKDDKKTSYNIWREVAVLKRTTEIKIDPKNDVVAYLIEVRNIAKEIIKEREAA